jgi:rhamnose transport system ATP-binding protein
MTEPILQLTDIHKKFPGVHALKGVQFDMYAGEVHALLGENGAGKSTLIKAISGVHPPTSGEIRMEGQSVEFNNPREAQQHGIATIYQELGLYPELTVAENIFMGHAPRRRVGPFTVMDWRQMEAEALRILGELDIYDLDVRQKVGTLNVGNRQRVEIAKALSVDAKILIMDEPTAALTESDVERLFVIVRLLRERGVGIIYISHRLQEVFELADRVTVLRDGEYIDTRPVSDTTEQQLITMMVGRTIDNLFPKKDPNPGEVVLQVRNLNYGVTTRNVSFSVRAGEIVGLAGLVGSGRSETAQVIFGITPAESGEILIDGKQVKINHPREAIEHGIAYVPEDRGSQGLIREMTLRENASMATMDQVSSGGFINRNAEQNRAARAIAEFEVRAYSTEQVANKLSGGNQQKIVIAKWLESNPRVLIMDEPTRGIDVGAKSEIHRRMSELAVEQGFAILMISSELPEVLGMSDRVLVMREGRIVAEFSRAEADQEKVAAAMMTDTNNIQQEESA